MLSLSKLYERHAEDCTRAAEQTDDAVFRKMLLMLALQWKLAAQEEAATQSTGNRGREGPTAFVHEAARRKLERHRHHSAPVPNLPDPFSDEETLPDHRKPAWTQSLLRLGWCLSLPVEHPVWGDEDADAITNQAVRAPGAGLRSGR